MVVPPMSVSSLKQQPAAPTENKAEKINKNIKGCKNKEREVKLFSVRVGIYRRHLLYASVVPAYMESTLSQSLGFKCNSIVLKAWKGPR